MNKTEILRVCDGVTWYDIRLLYRLKIPGGYCAVYSTKNRWGGAVSIFEPNANQKECGLIGREGDEKC